MKKTADEIRDNRDKLLIVMELVKQNIGKKYLNQVIGFLDDLAEEAAPKKAAKKPTKKAKPKYDRYDGYGRGGWAVPYDGARGG